MNIGIDFDGTCVTHEYPRIGKDINAVPILSALVERGHNLILITMRSGQELKEAVKWFKENNIDLYSINSNPTQHKWTTSPKIYAHLYIDDAGLGVPLIYNPEYSTRPYVDWDAAYKILKEKGILL